MGRPTTVLLAFLTLIAPLSLTAQDWRQGEKVSRKDLVPTAVTDGELTSSGKVVYNQVEVSMACTGESAGPRTFELRFLSPQYDGYNPSLPLTLTSIDIDGVARPAKAGTFLLHEQAFYIAEPDAPTVAKIAGVGEKHNARLAFEFVSSGRKFTFVAKIAHPNVPVAAVLAACGVTVEPSKPIPPTAAAIANEHSAAGKYSIEGVGLGMTEAQVLAALQKIGGTDHFGTSQGGYKAAKTRDVSFDTLQFNNAGGLSSMHVSAPNPARRKETSNSGPTYDLAVKLFGPPERQTNNGAFWGAENSGKSFAEYQVGDPGDPSDLWVCDGGGKP